MERELLSFAESIAKTNPLLAYIFFFFNSVLQVTFPPYPGDSVIIFQGYLSSIGLLSPALLFLSTFSGTISSSVFLYMISLKLGKRLINGRFIKKYFDTEKIYNLKNWFDKYGAAAIIINKFIPGIGSLTLISAGLFKLKTLPALLAIVAASLLHNTILFMAGSLTGKNINMLQKFVGDYEKLILSGILIISAIYIYLKYMHIKKEHL